MARHSGRHRPPASAAAARRALALGALLALLAGAAGAQADRDPFAPDVPAGPSLEPLPAATVFPSAPPQLLQDVEVGVAELAASYEAWGRSPHAVIRAIAILQAEPRGPLQQEAEQAVTAMARLAGPAVVAQLEEALRHPDGGVRQGALALFSNSVLVHPREPSTAYTAVAIGVLAPLLVRSCHDLDPAVRTQALAVAFGVLAYDPSPGPRDDMLVAELRRRLGDPDAGVARFAARELFHLGMVDGLPGELVEEFRRGDQP
jgi:hypothetical protein